MGASDRSTNDPSELQPCSLPASASPRKSRLRQRLMLIGFALPNLAAWGIAVLHEEHTSRMLSRELA
ncbi:hypothetical protein, partial [Escherichia coli]|uniref:hypothetical protein n=1 Tax=Escherichia coli TaxID=562 RepID=UPI00390CD009